MGKQVVSEIRSAKGDDALQSATGKTWDEWFVVLDAVAASEWKHAEIARWLAAEHRVDDWWAQGIAIGYEQARGIRRPGQRQDGSFEVSVSKTLPLEKAVALNATIASVSDALGSSPVSTSPDVKYPTARWRLDSDETLLATVTPNGERSSVSLTWARMNDDSRLLTVKDRMRSWLAATAE